MTLTSILIQVLLTLVPAVALIGWFARPATDPAEVTAFAESHGLEVTERNRPMVTYYVRLSITLRVTGAVSGLVLGALFDDATGLDTSAGLGFWIWILLGWLLGSGWAEYRLTRPRSSALVASLNPRRVEDYLPRGLLLGPVIAAGIVVLLAIARLVGPASDVPEPVPAPKLAYVAGAGLASIAAALVLLAIRTVIARRQPIDPPEVVAADDAIRASAVHNLAGGGTAAILLVSAQLTYNLASGYQHLSGVGFALALLQMAGAFASWRWFAYRHWRVRRQQPSTRTTPL